MGWGCCCSRRCAGLSCGSDSAPRLPPSFVIWSRPISQRVEAGISLELRNRDCNVKLEYIPLAGTFLRLQPLAPDLKEEVPSSVDGVPDDWPTMPITPMAGALDAYCASAWCAPPSRRI